jgi:signal transduction histidine kinase
MEIDNTSHEISFFSEAALELAELPLDQDIHSLVSKHLKALSGKAVVFTTSFNAQTQGFHVRQIQGIGSQMKYLADLLGVKRQRILPPVDRQAEARLRTGELHHVEGGFYELGFKAIPHFVCQEIENLLRLDRAYEIGFFWRHEIYGTAVIYLRQDQPMPNVGAIQFYAQVVSLLLRQRAQQVLWGEARDTLEDRVSAFAQQLQDTKSEQFDFDAALSREVTDAANDLDRRAKMLLETVAADGAQVKREDLLEIQQISESISNMGKSMLDLAALKAGKLEMRPDAVVIRDSVHDALSELSIRAHEKGILLVVEVQPSLPPVAADRDGLRHVIENLVSNAVNCTPAGGVITVRARCDDDRAYISVTDTGRGIDPADQSKVFEPFSHLEDRPDRRFKGAGLGLTMVRELVEQMHGSVDLQSKPAKGSTFTIALPLADTQPKVAPQ